MTTKPHKPALVLFAGDHGKWCRAGSLSTALGKSKEVVVAWDKGKESIFYLDRRKANSTYDQRTT